MGDHLVFGKILTAVVLMPYVVDLCSFSEGGARLNNVHHAGGGIL